MQEAQRIPDILRIISLVIVYLLLTAADTIFFTALSVTLKLPVKQIGNF